MILVLAYVLFLGAGVLGVAVQSPSVEGMIGVLGLAVLAGVIAALWVERGKASSAKLAASLGGALLGGGVICLLSLPSEKVGWVLLALTASVVSPTIFLMIWLAGFAGRPLGEAGSQLGPAPKERTRNAERAAVRLGIPILLLASCFGALSVSLHTAKSEIPSFAFGSHVVLAVQIALLFFYGALLLLVPLARALFDGDLPVELSLRGARWKESLVGLSEGLFEGQKEAAKDALQADVENKQEMVVLKKELKAADEAQEELTDEALKRIRALENRIGNPGVGR